MQKQRTEIEFCALFRCSPQKFSFYIKLWHNAATPHACRLITRNRINTAPTIKKLKTTLIICKLSQSSNQKSATVASSIIPTNRSITINQCCACTDLPLTECADDGII